MTRIGEIAHNLTLGERGVWVAPMPAAVSYPEEGNAWCLEIEESSFWFRHRNNCILAAMDLHPPSGAVFDIGGGNGFVATAIQNAGREVVVVEPGLQGATNARARGIEQVICATLESAGFERHVAPAVGLFDVLEHIDDDGGFLRQVRELLITGGRLYLTVPAHQILWSAEDDYGGHFRRYSMSRLARTLEQGGFKVDFATYIFSALPGPIFLFRALPSLLRLRRGVTLQAEKREHDPRRGLLLRTLEWGLERELSRLREGRPSRIGASILAVASTS